MDRRINEGIIDLNERKQKINEENIHVLEQVKDILTIGEADLITVQMCADYFEVDKNVLEVLISRNREELEENGLKVYKRKEFRELALNLHNVSLEIFKYKDSLKLTDMTLDITNRGITLLNKRTLLNIGMLLRDSKIAKELRRRILDVVHDAKNGNGSIETVVNEIDEEKKLSMELGAAIVEGNLSKVVEETERLFNEVKEQILNKEYEKAKEGFERIFYEEIPSDAIIKMAQLGENELNINMETWCQNFIRTGKGFHMLIYQYI